MNNRTCEQCGGQLIKFGKSTMTGEHIGEYECKECKHLMFINEGVALWKVYEQDREQEERNKN